MVGPFGHPLGVLWINGVGIMVVVKPKPIGVNIVYSCQS